MSRIQNFHVCVYIIEVEIPSVSDDLCPHPSCPYVWFSLLRFIIKEITSCLLRETFSLIWSVFEGLFLSLLICPSSLSILNLIHKYKRTVCSFLHKRRQNNKQNKTIHIPNPYPVWTNDTPNPFTKENVYSFNNFLFILNHHCSQSSLVCHHFLFIVLYSKNVLDREPPVPFSSSIIIEHYKGFDPRLIITVQFMCDSEFKNKLEMIFFSTSIKTNLMYKNTKEIITLSFIVCLQ